MFVRNRKAKELLRSTYLLYVALFLGQLVFCGVVLFFVTQPDNDIDRSLGNPFLGGFLVFFAVSTAFYVNHLRKQQVTKLSMKEDGELEHYRTSIILRSAMIEGGNLFCLVLAFLENSLTPVLFFCVGLVAFLFFRPNLNELVKTYGLDEARRQELERFLKNR